jgi:hypothetical protein
LRSALAATDPIPAWAADERITDHGVNQALVRTRTGDPFLTVGEGETGFPLPEPLKAEERWYRLRMGG